MGYLVALCLLAEVSTRLAGQRINPLVIVITTAVVLDIRADWLARRATPNLVAVWPEHRPFAVDAALKALAGHGISAHAHGLHGRLMLQFFGPFVPIEIMVHPDQAEDARRVVHRVLTGREAPAPPAPDQASPNINTNTNTNTNTKAAKERPRKKRDRAKPAAEGDREA